MIYDKKKCCEMACEVYSAILKACGLDDNPFIELNIASYGDRIEISMYTKDAQREFLGRETFFYDRPDNHALKCFWTIRWYKEMASMDVSYNIDERTGEKVPKAVYDSICGTLLDYDSFVRLFQDCVLPGEIKRRKDLKTFDIKNSAENWK